MRNFDYITNPAKLLTPEIVQMVGSIHEHKGKQELFLEANIDELKTLLEVALIQSTGASNRIEGIFTSDKRLEELCARFLEAWEANLIDKLILIPMFILDFLCIHPFNDGNGRMSRLLTLLLFYKAGYIVGKYVSMEMLIEKTKETYYEALQASSIGWHEGENSYEPFVKYYLGIILKAYNEFESRVEHLKYHNLSKPDRIKAVIDNKVGKITKKEIMELCPDISKVTVERTLTDLVKSGYIAKVGAGPSTGYVRI